MAVQRTFSIIKPNAVKKNVIGAIYNRFESAGFTENATHGSDSEESAAREIAYFFAADEICPR